MEELTMQQLLKLLVFAANVIEVKEEDLLKDLSFYSLVAHYDEDSKTYIFRLGENE